MERRPIMGNEYKKIISEKKGEAGILMTSKQLKECNIAIHMASAAAAASGAIPLPGVDAVPISTAQITMVIALGKIFDQKLSESAAKGMLSATVSTFVGRNLIKMIPIAGWGASATVAAGVTEALGWIVAADFAKMSRNRNAETEKDVSIDHTVSREDIFRESDIHTDAKDEPSDDQEAGQVDNEQQDDESMANDFARAFGEEEE